MRLAARIIGFISAGSAGEFIGEGAYVLLLAARGVPVFADACAVGGVLLGVFSAIGLAACILSWWRERAAGIMLVSAAAAMGIFVSIFRAPAIIPGQLMIFWLWMGLPYLVAGILFLNSWRLSQELA